MKLDGCYSGTVRDGPNHVDITVCITEDGVRLATGKRSPRSIDTLISNAWRIIRKLMKNRDVYVRVDGSQAIVILGDESFIVTKSKTVYNVVEIAELLHSLSQRGYL